MKKLLKITVLLLAIGVQPLNAQQIDMQEMRQDIDILEGVLEEMFETEWAESGNVLHLYTGSVILGGAGEPEGVYLPDFGVLFTVPYVSNGIVNYDKNDGHKTQYNRFKNGKKVTKEAVVDRIIEFLGDYGTTIDQLSGNSKIMVLYKANGENTITVMPFEAEKLELGNQDPITVIADYRDLQAFQSDEIDKNELRKRLIIDVTSKEIENQSDLKIMTNILETAFDEEKDEKFEISGDVEYLKIDNFGALFSFEISYGNLINGIRVFGEEVEGIRLFGEEISDSLISLSEKFSNVKWDSLYNVFAEIKWDSLFTVMNKSLQEMGMVLSNINFDSLGVDSVSASVKRDFDVTVLDSPVLDSLSVSIKKDLEEIKEEMPQKPSLSTNIKVEFTEEAQKAMEERKKKLRENSEEALNNFMSRLKELIIKYGPTLDSVSPNQMLLFSIEVNSGFDELPERIVVQVEKSVLRAAGRGEISRYEAMEEVSVRKIQ